MHTTNSHHPALVVFFDGQCPLCTREINHYRRLDGRNKIEWRDLHFESSRLANYGLTLDRAMRELQAVVHASPGSFKVVSGVDAFLEIWERIERYRWLAWIVSSRPVKLVANPLYRTFAKYRHLLRRTDQCSSCAVAESNSETQT